MTAYEIYTKLSDMDIRDYDETRENDIAFIQTMINTHGAKKAYRLLCDMQGVTP